MFEEQGTSVLFKGSLEAIEQHVLGSVRFQPADLVELFLFVLQDTLKLDLA